jgi:hypothetical protein
MISGIGASASYFNSLFATHGPSGSGGTNSATPLAQTEEKLFAAIDSNGDGSISQSEFSSFLDQSAAAAGAGAPPQAAASALFNQMSGGSGSISLQQFEANAGDLVSQLQSEISAGKSGGGSSAIAALLGQLSQSMASLAAGSAASIASSSQSNAASNTNNTGNSAHHHHHGGHGGSLISQFMQQYQAAGAAPTTVAATVSATV